MVVTFFKISHLRKKSLKFQKKYILKKTHTALHLTTFAENQSLTVILLKYAKE
jgi:hypothetical protein